MKTKISNVYGYCTMFGAAAGYYFSAISNSLPDLGTAHDVYFLEDMTMNVLFAIAGAVGGAGLASIYVAGKKVHDFFKKKISSENKGGNLEKLIEK